MLDLEWAEAQAWMAVVLAERGTPVTGPAVVDRDRPWSRVARVPVAGGQVWFKRNNLGSRYEAGLLRLLAAVAPDDVLVPVAVRPERGWLLLPDGGPTLRSLTEDRFAADRWEDLLRRYGSLQRAVSGHVPDMLAAGVPDVRPHRLVGLLSELLDDAYVVANLDGQTVAALREWRPRIEKIAARLAASGIPASVQHDDMHPGNVFVDAAGGLRFFDFGDASVAHPFGSMLVALRVVHRDAKVERGDPLLHRMRDAYLSAWGGPEDLAELRSIADDASTAAKIGKALSYQRALVEAGEAELAEYGDGVYGWLEELLGEDVI